MPQQDILFAGQSSKIHVVDEKNVLNQLVKVDNVDNAMQLGK